MALPYLLLFRHLTLTPKDHGETARLQNIQVEAMLKRIVHSLGLVENTKKDSKGKHKLKGIKNSQEFSSRSSKDFLVKIRHVSGKKEHYRHAIPASKLMTKHHGMCVASPEVFNDPHHSVLNREELLLPGHKYILISSKEVDMLKRKPPVHGSTKEPNGVMARSPCGNRHKENGKVKVLNGVSGHETCDEITRSPSGQIHHRENGKMKQSNGVAGQEMLETMTDLFPCGCKGQGNCKTKEANEKVEEIENDTVVDGFLRESVVEQPPFVAAKEKWTRSRRKGINGKKPFVRPIPKGRPYPILGWQPSLPTVKELSP